MLHDLPLDRVAGPVPRRAAEFIEEGLRRGKAVDCFDYVPGNYQVAFAVLRALAPGRFCEWGSGMGIVTGLAAMLGHVARGIEIDPRLAAASRRLLADFGLEAAIETGDYFAVRREADVYYAYCWPGQVQRVEERFEAACPDHARLILYYGPEDVRFLGKRAAGP